MIPLLLVTAGSLVYLNSFAGVFVFDDTRHIVQNERIHTLWPPWDALETRRPTLNLSLAVNYAISGTNVWGYHAVNLAVHVLAGLVLFGIVRRTWELVRLKKARGEAPARDDRMVSGPIGRPTETTASWGAFAVALIWLVHPLQTQSVTYVIQRSESLMGLFYLLAMYCVIRSADSARCRWWCVASVASAALGMGSKAVMVTVPVIVLLYDRLFLSCSLGRALRRRWGLYLGLTSTWILLWVWGVAPSVLIPSDKAATVGFSVQDITPLEYALTQPGVILHYLRLAFWPLSLCLDYDWPTARGWSQIVPQAVLVGMLLAGSVWSLSKSPWLGFSGAWFFLILAPTSSVVPIKDMLFEHRMYLPLAAVVVCAVTLAHAALRYGFDHRFGSARGRQVVSILLTGGVAVTLGLKTVGRNADYHSLMRIWSDVVAKRPNNARGHYNLGWALAQEGSIDEAMIAYHEAIRLQPDHVEAHNNLGQILAQSGEFDQSAHEFREALRIRRDYPEAHNNLGGSLEQMGHREEAIREYREALRIHPDFAPAHANLANVLAAEDRLDEAFEAYEAVVRLQPDNVEAHINLGNVLTKQGRLDRALNAYRAALGVQSESGEPYLYLGNALAALGRFDDAIRNYRTALRIQPNYADAHNNLGNALLEQGKFNPAVAAYRAALETRPNSPVTYANLGVALRRLGRLDEALAAYRQAASIDPQNADVHFDLGNALTVNDFLEEAIAEYRAAIRLDPDHAAARQALETVLAARRQARD